MNIISFLFYLNGDCTVYNSDTVNPARSEQFDKIQKRPEMKAMYTLAKNYLKVCQKSHKPHWSIVQVSTKPPVAQVFCRYCGTQHQIIPKG